MARSSLWAPRGGEAFYRATADRWEQVSEKLRITELRPDKTDPARAMEYSRTY
jgi:hypothetical protein